MSVVALDESAKRDQNEPIVSEPGKTGFNPRTNRLLNAPIFSTLLLLAWPNVLVTVAQASTGLIETWFISRLGTDALAGMALVFPGVMLMQMISAGAMGGGISSAIARAWRRTSGRRGCPRSARTDHQRGSRGTVLDRNAGVRPSDLPGARRRRG